MKRSIVRVSLVVCMLLVAGSLNPGLAGKKKREKHVENLPRVDLSAFSVLYVDDFKVIDPKAMDNAKRETKAKLAAKNIPDLVVEALAADEGAFDEVLRGPMQGRSGAAALQAVITTYKPGSKSARFMMAGAGKAKLQMVVTIVETETGKEVISFPINRTWAWGGHMGASKGIEDMDKNVATELAMYLRNCRHDQ